MWPFKYPYTNFHELNLDWILQKVKEVDNRVNSLVTSEGNFVTPEQYGAVADGQADDTAAINSAVNSGKPVLLSGNYKAGDITINSDNFYIIISTPLTCGTMKINGSNGNLNFVHLTCAGISASGANNSITGGLLLNDGTEYTSGVNILANNTRVDIVAINNFYTGISLGYSIISANGCVVNFNSMYGCTIGIQINAGVRNIFNFGTMANTGTGDGIFVNPVETAVGENRFIFGSISGYNYGVRYNNSSWNAEGYTFIGSIFSCHIGFSVGEGVHGYITYIGTIDNIDIENSVDVDDKSYKNNWIMPYVRRNKSDFAATSKVTEMETGTVKLPIVNQPASGVKGDLIFTTDGNIVYHNGSTFRTVTST